MSRCPRCATSLVDVHRHEVHLLACSGCGGVWMSGATLHRFAEALRARPEAIEAAQGVADRALFEMEPDGEVIGCPSCKKPMAITRHPSGVHLDVCAEHGVWFDRDELPQVVHQPEGLVAVEAAEKRLVAAPPPPPPSSAGLDGDALVVAAEVVDAAVSSDPSALVDVAEAGVSLVGGAIGVVGELAGGALELVFGVFENLDLS